tara:strand:+ start:1598 stop:1822 length:225 start_codon:yes stop_codon:yes gene_type:complete
LLLLSVLDLAEATPLYDAVGNVAADAAMASLPNELVYALEQVTVPRLTRREHLSDRRRHLGMGDLKLLARVIID